MTGTNIYAVFSERPITYDNAANRDCLLYSCHALGRSGSRYLNILAFPADFQQVRIFETFYLFGVISYQWLAYCFDGSVNINELA